MMLGKHCVSVLEDEMFSAMLTIEKIKTYKKFSGDIDGYSRGCGSSCGITHDDWRLIDELLGALYIIDTGKASPQFFEATQEKLLKQVADEQTREELRKLSKT